MKNSIILQRLKPLNRWTIALIVGGIAVTGGSLYYSISQFGQKPVEPVAPAAPTIQPITALGRLEPASEVVRVAAPATLNNDRVAQLLVKRGDRVQVGQEIAILDSRERLQTVLLEAQERVSTAQARLAQVVRGFLENCVERFAKLGCKSASKKSSAISPDRTSIAASLRSEFALIQRIVNKWQA